MPQWLWSTPGASFGLSPRWLLSPMAPWMLQQVRSIDYSFSSTNRCITFSLGYKYLLFETEQAHVSVSSSPDYVEMWIVMVSMVSGCLMYTVLVANATAMIANVDPAAKEYKSKVQRREQCSDVSFITEQIRDMLLHLQTSGNVWYFCQ